MANIWQDKRTYVDENKFVSAKVQQSHPRVHSVKKKQVFGELKNVMHNQIGVTPLKGGGGLNVLTNRGNNKYNDAGCPASNKKSCKLFEAEYNNKSCTTGIDPIELFDLFDFPKLCCSSSCTKSVEEIWAEYNQIDESVLMKAMMKIRNGSSVVDDFDDEDDFRPKKFPKEEEERYQMEEEEMEKLLTESLDRQLYVEDYTTEHFSPCSLEMPKFDIFNDFPLLDVN